jgi:uncharacterized protein
VPFLSGRVVDEAEMLSPAAEEVVSATLERLERDTGHQVAVLSVASLQGEPLEDFSHRVASTWALGRQDHDDGVLFLIARDERRMRIEVGYGLEGRFPDALAGRILRDLVTPRFRSGDFEGGIKAGVDAIAAVLEGRGDAVPVAPRAVSSGAKVADVVVVLLLLQALIVLILMVSRRRRQWRGRGVRGPWIAPWGGGFGGRSGGFGGGFSGGGGSFGGGGASGGW